ncbi:MAG: hypothetical protein WD032_09155 [Nitrospirales bacterium]
MLHSAVAVLEFAVAAAKAWGIAAGLGAVASKGSTSHEENVPMMSLQPQFYQLPLQNHHTALMGRYYLNVCFGSNSEHLGPRS